MTVQELLKRVQLAVNRGQLLMSDGSKHSLSSVCFTAGTTRRQFRRVKNRERNAAGELYTLTWSQVETFCSMMGYEIDIVEKWTD